MAKYCWVIYEEHIEHDKDLYVFDTIKEKPLRLCDDRETAVTYIKLVAQEFANNHGLLLLDYGNEKRYEDDEFIVEYNRAWSTHRWRCVKEQILTKEDFDGTDPGAETEQNQALQPGN